MLPHNHLLAARRSINTFGTYVFTSALNTMFFSCRPVHQVTALLTSRCSHGTSLMMAAAASGSVGVWDAVMKALCQSLETDPVRLVCLSFGTYRGCVDHSIEINTRLLLFPSGTGHTHDDRGMRAVLYPARVRRKRRERRRLEQGHSGASGAGTSGGKLGLKLMFPPVGAYMTRGRRRVGLVHT